MAEMAKMVIFDHNSPWCTQGVPNVALIQHLCELTSRSQTHAFNFHDLHAEIGFSGNSGRGRKARTLLSRAPEESETRTHSSAALRCISRIGSFPGPGPGIDRVPRRPTELVRAGPEVCAVTAIGLVHPSSPATIPPSPPQPFQAHPERCLPRGALPVALLCTTDVTAPSRLLSLDAVERRREMPPEGETSHVVEGGGESPLVERLREKSSLPSRVASTGI